MDTQTTDCLDIETAEAKAAVCKHARDHIESLRDELDLACRTLLAAGDETGWRAWVKFSAGFDIAARLPEERPF